MAQYEFTQAKAPSNHDAEVGVWVAVEKVRFFPQLTTEFKATKSKSNFSVVVNTHWRQTLQRQDKFMWDTMWDLDWYQANIFDKDNLKLNSYFSYTNSF